jgi:hypothetical protein
MFRQKVRLYFLTYFTLLQYFKNTGTGRGTIVSVDPRGWVEVSWDQGSRLRVTAGYQGLYSVQLF